MSVKRNRATAWDQRGNGGARRRRGCRRWHHHQVFYSTLRTQPSTWWDCSSMLATAAALMAERWCWTTALRRWRPRRSQVTHSTGLRRLYDDGYATKTARAAPTKHGHGSGHGGAPARANPWRRNAERGLPKAKSWALQGGNGGEGGDGATSTTDWRMERRWALVISAEQLRRQWRGGCSEAALRELRTVKEEREMKLRALGVAGGCWRVEGALWPGLAALGRAPATHGHASRHAATTAWTGRPLNAAIQFVIDPIGAAWQRVFVMIYLTIRDELALGY